jgi:hypothetical protein
MANNEQIILELKAKTTKLEAALKRIQKETKKTDKEVSRFRISTAGLRRSIGALRNNMLLVSFAFGGTLASVNKLVSAYGQQELAEKKLSAALGFTSKALLTQASALQQTTSFGDEAIIGVQALIGAFTKDEEQIKVLTQTTLDLAAAKGMDLTAAADLVSKSFGSSTNALSRYGIQVEGAVGSTERLENLTGNVAALFGGQASAQADTMTGSIQQMQNALGDTTETMGALLAPATIVFSKSIKKAAEGWSEFFLELKETEMETAVRQLREMGAAAEDLALLEQFVQVEKHSEAIINNNQKIRNLIQDQNTLQGNKASLSIEELTFLGAQTFHVKSMSSILAGTLPLWERKVSLANLDQVTQKNISILMSNIAKRNDEIISKGQDNVILHKDEITLNSKKLKDLQEILILIKQQEAARKALTDVGKDDPPDGEGGSGDSPSDEDMEAWEKFLAKQKEIVDTQEEFTFMMAEKHIAYAIEQQLLADWIENNKELAESMGIVTDAQKKMNDEQDKQDKARKRQREQIFKDSADIGRLALKDADAAKNAAIDKIASYAMTAAAKQMEKIITQVPFPFNIPLAAAGGLAVGAAVGGLADKLKAAQYGMNEVVDQPTLILAGEAGAEQVSITPLESPNIDGVQGGGASVVVNVSGNVLTSDFVEGELADNIREAVRRGTDFGIG